MTSLTSNTSATNINAMLSMSSFSSFEEKDNAGKNYTFYSTPDKNWTRKSSSRLSSIDWDLNMNELEFE